MKRFIKTVFAAVFCVSAIFATYQHDTSAATRKISQNGEIIKFANNGFACSNTASFCNGENDGNGKYYDSTASYDFTGVDKFILYPECYQNSTGTIKLSVELRDGNTDAVIYGPKNISTHYTDKNYHPFIWDITNCTADLSNAYIYSEAYISGAAGNTSVIRGMAPEIRCHGTNIGGVATLLYPTAAPSFEVSDTRMYYYASTYTDEKEYKVLRQNMIPFEYPLSKTVFAVDSTNDVFYAHISDGSSSPGNQPFATRAGVFYSNTFDITQYDKLDWWSTVGMTNNHYYTTDGFDADGWWPCYLILLKENETINIPESSVPNTGPAINKKAVTPSGEQIDRPYIKTAGEIDLAGFRASNNITGSEKWKVAFIQTVGELGYEHEWTMCTPAVLKSDKPAITAPSISGNLP